MNKKDEAIAKMTQECQGKEYLIPFEEYLTGICNEHNAEKILAEGKTLQGAFAEMKEIARKRQVNGCAYIPPEEGFEIIKKYFDIQDEDIEVKKEETEVIDILDFL